jgi:hypothetical protein
MLDPANGRPNVPMRVDRPNLWQSAFLGFLRHLALLAILSAFVPGLAEAEDGLRARSLGVPMGLKSFVPGRWGLVRIAVANQGEDEGVLPAYIYLKDNPSLRFERDVWVPPHAVRGTWIPLHMPPDATGGQSGMLDVHGHAGGKEFSEPARLKLDPYPMAMLGDAVGIPSASGNQEEPENEAYEAVIALRVAKNLTRQVLAANERFLPPSPEAWEAVKHIVIAGNRLAGDSAGQSALRQWLASGGKMWIQLDSTPPETVRSLLGDAFRVEVVDRVELSTLPDDFSAGGGPSSDGELDVAVQHLRVLVDDAEVLSRVHGWPASFVIPFGRGEVIVTTLGPRGWMRLRNSSDPVLDPRTTTRYVAINPLLDLMVRFLNAPSATLPTEELQVEYLTQKIGYEVPSRTTVLGLLIGFCTLIALAGMILGRQHRLEGVAALTVIAGLIAAGAIVGLGTAKRQAVPATAASVRFAEVVPQADTLTTTGSLAVYQPDLTLVELNSPAGTRLDPQIPDLAGQIRQLKWTDLNQWHFDRVELPPGVRVFNAESAITLSQPPRVVARFGGTGLEGKLTSGDFSSPEDAFLAATFGKAFAIHLADDGTFHAGPGDPLPPGQFMADQLLSDEQLQRQKLAAAWFAGRTPDQALRLLAWVNPPSDQMKWSAGTRQVGAVMLSVPVTIERTPPDTAVALPAGMLEVRSVEGSSGRSTFFDNRTRSWQSPKLPATATRLRWQLPAAVLPLKLDRAVLTIECNIPSRPFGVFALRDGQRVPVLQRTSPAGRIEVEIKEPDLLRLDESGGIAIEFDVGELDTQVAKAAASTGGWSILSTDLDVYGRTLPDDSEDNP